MKIRFKSYWPLLVLIGLVVIFMADVCFGGNILFLRDFFDGDVGTRILFGRALRGGIFRLWNSLDGCGYPVAASPSSGAFYPPNLIFALSDPELAIRIWWVFHLAVGAISFYWLARHWKLEIAPALYAAVSFAFSTFVFTWMEFAHAFTCLVWGPLVLLLVSMIIARTVQCQPFTWRELFRSNAATVPALGAAIALQIISSGEFCYYTALIVGAYAIFKWTALKNWKICGLSILQLGIAALVALALAAPFLALLGELMPLTTRAGEVDPLARIDSAHPRYWLTFLIPFLYGRPGYPDAFWAPKVYEFAIGHCYIGVLPLLSALFCFNYFNGQAEFREKRFLVMFFLACGVVALAMAAGDCTFLYGAMHRYLPGLGHLRFPTKFFLSVTYSFSMLGALGFQALLEPHVREESGQKKIWSAVLMLVVIFCASFIVSLLHQPFLVWLMGHPGAPSAEQIHSVTMDFLMAAVYASAGTILLWFLVFKEPHARWLQISVVAVAFINLWIVSRQTQPTVRAGIYSPEWVPLQKEIQVDPMYRAASGYQPMVQYLYGEKRRDILEWVRFTGAARDFEFHGLAKVIPPGFDPNRSEMFYNLLTASPQNGDGQFDPRIQGMAEKIADMMSLRQILGGTPFDQVLWNSGSRDFTVRVRPSALPRAFVTTRWRVVPDGNSALNVILRDFDPHQEAVIETIPGELSSDRLVALPDAASSEIHAVTSLVDRQESLSIEASVTQHSLLVLSDTWYPGWTATVDGRQQPIYRANYQYRGIFLEPGAHRIEFKYMPKHLFLGVLICVAAVLVSILGVWISHLIPLPPPPVEPKSRIKARSDSRTKPRRNAKKSAS